MSRESVRAALSVFGISRAILVIVTIVVAALQRHSAGFVWTQWDAVWYLGIAQHGYHWVAGGHVASAYPESSVAFFPLLPLLVHLIAAPGIPAVAAGLLVANAAFLGALIYLYLFLTDEWGDAVARRSLLVLALFPTAFFFAAPYTEAVFLLAAVGTVFHARRGNALRAGLWLGAAALTRSTAIILVAPALLLLRPRDVRCWVALLAPALAGWLAFLLYLRAEGVPLTYVVAAQHAWHRGLTFPWTGFTSSVVWLLHNAISQWPIAIESVGELVATVLVLALTAHAWRDLSVPMRTYCAGFWLLVLCSPEWLNGYAAPFSSVDRFVLVLFPLAGWVAWRLPSGTLRLILVGSALTMAGLAGDFLNGSWIG